MKKLLILLFCLFLSAPLVNAQFGGTIHNLGNGIVVMGVSPNGEYATGYSYSMGGFIWTKAAGIKFFDPGDGSQANCVSNNGVVAGRFYDWSLPYRFWDPWEEKEMPLFSGGYYKDGAWHSLGIDPNMPEDEVFEDSGSNAEGISADGTIIGGSMDLGNWILKPVIWTNGEHTVWEFQNAGQGAKIVGLSADGNVACGWAAPDFDRLPIVWVNGQMRKISHNNDWNTGEAFNVSPNGKYVTLEYMGQAAIYNVEQNQLTIIEFDEETWGNSATAVSNNGIVVGYYTIGFMDRCAFIYKQDIGVMKLGKYLELAGIPEAADIEFETPMAISADGLRIGGFGWDLGAWIVDVEKHIGIKTPNSESNFMVFPNPANNTITIQGEKFDNAFLYDVKGQLLMSTTHPNIDISILPAGNYVLRIESKEGHISTQKIVKQ
jgi:uncharacterized membrane protein